MCSANIPPGCNILHTLLLGIPTTLTDASAYRPADAPRVLVVDDDPHAHFFARRALSRGAGVRHFVDAWNGSEAIEVLRRRNRAAARGRITHVVLDLQMPVLDGFGFLEAFDGLPAGTTAGVRVVLVSSSPNPDDHARALAHPCVREVFEKALRPSDSPRVLGGAA